MGPPLKAAENLAANARGTLHDIGFNGAAAKSSGKSVDPFAIPTTDRASMGPPLKAAENDEPLPEGVVEESASMGPPLKAAENPR